MKLLIGILLIVHGLIVAAIAAGSVDPSGGIQNPPWLRWWPTKLGQSSAISFLLAAAALMRWFVPGEWFRWLIVAGAVLSIVLQVIWFSGWAVFPLLVNVALLWAVFGQHVTVGSLRG